MKNKRVAVRLASVVLCIMMLFAGCASEAETGMQMVWIPTNGGVKYHKDPDCSDMISPEHVSLAYAEAQGFTACKLCSD